MQIESGKAAGGVWIVAVICAVILACPVGLILVGGIESSRADRAGAVALAEQAKAGARVAEVQARVDETEVKADRDVQLQLDRQDHELALLREENRQFQERLVMLATVIEGMDAKKVNRLETLLGNGASPLVIAVAAALAVVAFLLLLVLFPLLRRYVNRRVERLWTT